MQKTLNDALRTNNQGVDMSVHVTPRSSESCFPAGFDPWRTSIEVKVTAEAKENKANREVLQTIATFFHIPITDISIVSGGKNRFKTIRICNVSKEIILHKIKEKLNGL
jgi:uncharacterized protein (TIGR00251 family)